MVKYQWGVDILVKYLVLSFPRESGKHPLEISLPAGFCLRIWNYVNFECNTKVLPPTEQPTHHKSSGFNGNLTFHESQTPNISQHKGGMAVPRTLKILALPRLEPSVKICIGHYFQIFPEEKLESAGVRWEIGGRSENPLGTSLISFCCIFDALSSLEIVFWTISQRNF